MKEREVKKHKNCVKYPNTIHFNGEDRVVNNWEEEKSLIKMIKRKNGELRSV